MEMQHIRQKQIVQVNNAEVWTLGRLVHDCIFLFSYAFIFLAVCLGSLTCWKMKQFLIRCFPDDIGSKSGIL